MPINGLRRVNATACAALNPTSSAIGKPGPCVAATASSCPGCTPASRNAVCTTGIKFRRCSRAASSGTTPPYSACNLICEETTLDKTRPSRTTAALVSSQEVSRAKRVMRAGVQALTGHTNIQRQAAPPEMMAAQQRGPTLFRGHFCRPIRAFAVKHDALEQISGAFELDVMNVFDADAIGFAEGFHPARRAFQHQSGLLFLGHGHFDVRRDAMLVNDLVTGRVIFGGREFQGRAVIERKNALHRAFAEGFLAKNDRAVQI